MRPYQPPSHVSRNKQYDARWKHNTTLGWIEIKIPLLGSQIAFGLNLGQSVQKYKMNGKFIKSENIRSLPDSMSNLSVRRGLVAFPRRQLILHCNVCRVSVDFGFMTRYFLPKIVLFDASPQWWFR